MLAIERPPCPTRGGPERRRSPDRRRPSCSRARRPCPCSDRRAAARGTARRGLPRIAEGPTSRAPAHLPLRCVRQAPRRRSSPRLETSKRWPFSHSSISWSHEITAPVRPEMTRKPAMTRPNQRWTITQSLRIARPSRNRLAGYALEAMAGESCRASDQGGRVWMIVVLIWGGQHRRRGGGGGGFGPTMLIGAPATNARI